MRTRKVGLDRGRTIGYYVTRRHEAQIVALATQYTHRERRETSHSQVLQMLVERDAKRLKVPEPVAGVEASTAETSP